MANNIVRIPEDPSCQPDPRGMGVLFLEKMKKYGNNIAQVSSNFIATAKNLI